MFHPQSNSFGGGSLKVNIIPAICCINELFWEDKFFAVNHSAILSFTNSFEDKCLILELGGQRILAHNFQLWESFKQGRNYYFVSIDIILGLGNGDIPTETRTFELSELIIEKDYLLGTTLEAKTIKVEITEKEENYSRYFIMRKMLTQLIEEQQAIYMDVIPIQVAEGGDLFLYNYAWE